MKRISVFAIFFIAVCLMAGPTATAEPQQVTLLHVNDTHSHLAA